MFGASYRQESRAVARKPRDAAAVLFVLKFADNTHYKFKSSQVSKARLQSSKCTGAKHNLTHNGHTVCYSASHIFAGHAYTRVLAADLLVAKCHQHRYGHQRRELDNQYGRPYLSLYMDTGVRRSKENLYKPRTTENHREYPHKP